MISHEYQCIFIHIPKTAGTSVERVLGHLDDFEGRGGQDHRSLRMIEQPFPPVSAFTGRDNLLEVARIIKYRLRTQANEKNNSTVDAEQYARYFKFTIVRNPWARAYSWYMNVMRDEEHLNDYSISNDMGFEEFVHRFAGKGLLRPQTYWIKDFSGNIPMDLIIRFEQLEDGFAEARKRLGLGVIDLPHEIKGASADFRQHYSPKSIATIEEIYADEISLFGYTFDEAH